MDKYETEAKSGGIGGGIQERKTEVVKPVE